MNGQKQQVPNQLDRAHSHGVQRIQAHPSQPINVTNNYGATYSFNHTFQSPGNYRISNCTHLFVDQDGPAPESILVVNQAPYSVQLGSDSSPAVMSAHARDGAMGKPKSPPQPAGITGANGRLPSPE